MMLPAEMPMLKSDMMTERLVAPAMLEIIYETSRGLALNRKASI